MKSTRAQGLVRLKGCRWKRARRWCCCFTSSLWPQLTRGRGASFARAFLFPSCRCRLLLLALGCCRLLGVVFRYILCSCRAGGFWGLCGLWGRVGRMSPTPPFISSGGWVTPPPASFLSHRGLQTQGGQSEPDMTDALIHAVSVVLVVQRGQRNYKYSTLTTTLKSSKFLNWRRCSCSFGSMGWFFILEYFRKAQNFSSPYSWPRWRRNQHKCCLISFFFLNGA